MSYNNGEMIGRDIIEIRNKTDLSQERFAQAVGVSLFSVANWEKKEDCKLSDLSVRKVEAFKRKYNMK